MLEAVQKKQKSGCLAAFPWQRFSRRPNDASSFSLSTDGLFYLAKKMSASSPERFTAAPPVLDRLFGEARLMRVVNPTGSGLAEAGGWSSRRGPFVSSAALSSSFSQDSGSARKMQVSVLIWGSRRRTRRHHRVYAAV